jgi:NADPH:quinone reductase-like Zn-dependent oxidoreductase
MSSTPVPSGHHLAAIVPSMGVPLEIIQRPTPTPGPNDVLIEVHSLALNPVDYFQRDSGFFINGNYPTFIGSDVAGTIISTGSSFQQVRLNQELALQHSQHSTSEATPTSTTVLSKSTSSFQPRM